MQFYSQYGEDQWIVENLSVPEHGVFVDVGAEDGVTFSNTYHFEQRGWTGICIEPDPTAFALLRQSRGCSCVQAAIGLGDPAQPFYIHPNKGWSGLANEGSGTAIEVAVRRLDPVLEEHGIEHIDLLSIDTEGTEVQVLHTLNVERYQPAIIIIEWNTWDGQVTSRDVIEAFFGSYPYKRVHETEGNLIFQRV